MLVFLHWEYCMLHILVPVIEKIDIRRDVGEVVHDRHNARCLVKA